MDCVLFFFLFVSAHMSDSGDPTRLELIEGYRRDYILYRIARMRHRICNCCQLQQPSTHNHSDVKADVPQADPPLLHPPVSAIKMAFRPSVNHSSLWADSPLCKERLSVATQPLYINWTNPICSGIGWLGFLPRQDLQLHLDDPDELSLFWWSNISDLIRPTLQHVDATIGTPDVKAAAATPLFGTCMYLPNVVTLSHTDVTSDEQFQMTEETCLSRRISVLNCPVDADWTSTEDRQRANVSALFQNIASACVINRHSRVILPMGRLIRCGFSPTIIGAAVLKHIVPLLQTQDVSILEILFCKMRDAPGKSMGSSHIPKGVATGPSTAVTSTPASTGSSTNTEPVNTSAHTSTDAKSQSSTPASTTSAAATSGTTAASDVASHASVMNRSSISIEKAWAHQIQIIIRSGAQL